MKLSNQALGAIMMALQKSLLEQSDIVPVLKSFDFKTKTTEGEDIDELIVTNPPSFEISKESFEFNEEVIRSIGSD